ncbi:biopolymer transporter ExbD [Aetokthonos hydrillicola Thurmond2011]|jgi:biopolymer transport protein ExbD|uniref:Biopolymer transporter ExbD n=1 Tax=Aetokthonos hydrillicola Thurmond2011 TaxID=2712845 RepID=A0AAP5M8Y4_9CYAN|nr:biopolymer transporter ExbD [Aetokthonos hydrillicola]MBO3458865.1 biopolymer transporter ExbD [Aetokthonos hydrillicola CCALA 1050]MBW4587287.1 biopolymer transporter ExbD [Aetokthonos hydrillicola CCALA 1050]MDR9896690.1 biopolymer transporter ExbD [Aetokthonos hydrillicola Thurmond2011]
MKVNLHTPLEETQVQIIPLIDVVFCILSFFILASLQFTRQQAINVDLPTAKTGSISNSSVMSQTKQQILPVTIDAIGQTYVEKQPVKREDLKIVLENYVRKNPKGILVLNASRSATYNDVIEMLDLLRQVGGDRVSLGIIPTSSQKPTNSQQPASPYLPNNPSTSGFGSVPNTQPVLPQIPLPSDQYQTGQQGINSINPGTYPVQPTQPVAPRKTR